MYITPLMEVGGICPEKWYRKNAFKCQKGNLRYSRKSIRLNTQGSKEEIGLRQNNRNQGKGG